MKKKGWEQRFCQRREGSFRTAAVHQAREPSLRLSSENRGPQEETVFKEKTKT